MATQRQQGESFIRADFFDNKDGLNITDSPFALKPSHASQGYNYEYSATGGIKRRSGNTLYASTTNPAQIIGLFQFNTSLGVKQLLAACGDGTLQTVTSGAMAVIKDDSSSALTDFFTSTQSVCGAQFNNAVANTCWLAGGGLSSGVLLGYNGNSVTVNGVIPPAGSISVTHSGSGGSLPAGSYYYAISYVKNSTSAESNAALDVAVTVTLGQNAVVSLSGLTGLDTTKIASINIYRSAVSGVTGFTAGDLVATVASTVTSYTDTGAIQGVAGVVPRAGSSSLDQSRLPAGTMNVVTTWKNRLVTGIGSTVYLSDLNKPESWPTVNTVSLPTGGQITALGIISFITPTTSTVDSYLVIFKENELWMMSGTSQSDWALTFVDYVGCINQPLLVFANGFLFWIDYRGVYIWDGSDKPIYASRLIEFDFQTEGDINLAYLYQGVGSFFKKQNEIIWFLSSNALGQQQLSLKLDLRLTLPKFTEAMYGRVLEAVFIKDALTTPIYAAQATYPSHVETYYVGDASGNVYQAFSSQNSDNGTAIALRYRTRTEDFGLIATVKRFHKIIVWCRQSTTKNLTLNYWVGYQTDPAHQATQTQQITTQVTNGYWDQATWDNFYWDTDLVTYTPVVFNMNNPSVGVEGDALTLEFVQNDLNAPITIAGYSVLYTVMGMRK